MEYKGYQHIERLGTSEVEGILDGECYIFPKIDGTNGQAWSDGNTIFVGSRKRFITPEDDNAGCAAAILQNDNICNYLADHVGHHLFFEWLVPHTIKNYEIDAWRKPYVFDVAIESGDSFVYLPYNTFAPPLESYGITAIKPMARIINPTNEQLMELLESNHYLMKDNAIGEGIVVKNYGYRNRYGRQTWAKVVRAEFHKQKGIPKPKTIGLNETEQAIIEKYITEAVVQKEKAKIENEVGVWESKYIGRLLSMVWYTLITEESYHFVKTFKNPIINFKELNRLCNERVKEILGIEKAEADRKVAETNAQAEANATITKAEAQAKANELLQESLNSDVLYQKWLEKWNGALPQVAGGDASTVIGNLTGQK